MIRFLLLFYFNLILFFCNISFSKSKWEIITSPTNKDLKNCYFLNNTLGWISGDSGVILHTSNGGVNWLIQNSGISKDIQSLFFINERIGWAVALQLNFDTIPYTGTIILKTSDGGNNWNRSMYPDTNVFMNSVYFLDSLNGFIGGAPEFIHYTTDGGLKWHQAVVDSAFFNGVPVHKILFLNDKIGYASGGSRDFVGSVWTTTNGGMNWKQKILGVDPITDLYIVNQDSLFGTGGDYKFGSNYFSTSSFGQNWQSYNLGYAGIATAIDFRTQKEGWIALGNSEVFFQTLNGGAQWTILTTPDSTAIFDVVFPDSLHGWAVGKEGIILKYNPTKVSVNTGTSHFILENFTLFQNYPNPFNPSTRISYTLNTSGNVKVKIYDAMGKEVSVIFNRNQKEGSYSFEFDGSNLPSGIYFYSVEVNNYSEVRKMILLK